MVGVEQWAEIRRMHRVERLSIREIHRRTGLHRKTVRRALANAAPPVYRRAPAGSKLDPFKGWIEEQLRVDPRLPSKRLRELAEELGFVGGKTIFDDFVRERARSRRAASPFPTRSKYSAARSWVCAARSWASAARS